MQLVPQIPLSVILVGCVMGTSAVVANLVYLDMVEKINEKLPESERISYFSGGTEVRKRFKQLYPENRLRHLLDSCLVVMVLCFIFLIRFWVFG